MGATAMADGVVRVSGAALNAFVRAVLARCGLPAEDAATVADILVWANLRGVDSHGVLRLPRYLDLIDRGLMNPRPDIRVVGETAAALIVDADRAMGAVALDYAMERAMAKARAAGIGWALVRAMTHGGAVG